MAKQPEPWRVRRFLDAADDNLIGERFRALSSPSVIGPRDVNTAFALVRIAARIISKAGVSGNIYLEMCMQEWPGELRKCACQLEAGDSPCDVHGEDEG